MVQAELDSLKNKKTTAITTTNTTTRVGAGSGASVRGSYVNK